MIEALRTPDERFSFIPAYPYTPRYVDDLPGYEKLRMAYVDEGADADAGDTQVTFLCLHGEPAWGYLYRKMIPVFTAAGHRVVAPDLLGFGRSDKPVDDDVYTIDFHRRSLLGLIERLDLRNVALVCQDWGGILGLTLPMEMPQRFTRLLVMNTWLPIGKPASEGFAGWMYFVENAPEFPVAALIVFDANGAANPFDAVAYDAPFPDNRYKAGVRRFPRIVPARPGMDGIELMQRARDFWSNDWQGDSFMAVGTRDQVITEDVMEELRGVINGCPEPMRVPQAGHFVQEYGEPVARAALEHFDLG